MKKKMCLLFALCLLFSFFTGCNYYVPARLPYEYGAGRWVDEKSGSWFETTSGYNPYLTGEIIAYGKVYPVALDFGKDLVSFYPAEKQTKPENIPKDIEGYPMLYGIESLPYFSGKWRCTDTTCYIYDICVAYTGYVLPEDVDRLEKWILPKNRTSLTFVRQEE